MRVTYAADKNCRRWSMTKGFQKWSLYYGTKDESLQNWTQEVNAVMVGTTTGKTKIVHLPNFVNALKIFGTR